MRREIDKIVPLLRLFPLSNIFRPKFFISSLTSLIFFVSRDILFSFSAEKKILPPCIFPPHTLLNPDLLVSAIPSLENIFSLDATASFNDSIGIALKKTREPYSLRNKKSLFLLYNHYFPEKKIRLKFL
ncbi:MAG: hypothetical protein WDA18_06955 [Candidatus Ratteibacteria bacterium]|jgi:hypothetical protein